MVLGADMVNPFRSLSYLENYIQVARGNETDASVGRKLMLAKVILLYSVAHYLVTFLVPMSSWTRWVLFDTNRILGLPPQTDIAVIILIYAIRLFQTILFTNNHNILTGLFEQVALNHDHRYFLSPFFRDRPISLWIRKVMLAIMVAYQTTIFVLDGLPLFFQVVICKKLSNHYSSGANNPWLVIRDLFLMEVNAFGFYALSAYFLEVVYIFTQLGVIVSLIIWIHLKQLHRLLRRRQSLANISYFIKRYTLAMGDIFEFNSVFGQSLFVFMLCDWPLSMIMIAFSISGRVNPISSAYVYMISVQQLSWLFGNHCLAAFYSLLIHRPGPWLMSASVRFRFRSIRDRLKLSLFSIMLHTRNRYGIAYGRGAGAVTFRAFLRFSFLYGKFLLITYKLFILRSKHSHTL